MYTFTIYVPGVGRLSSASFQQSAIPTTCTAQSACGTQMGHVGSNGLHVFTCKMNTSCASVWGGKAWPSTGLRYAFTDGYSICGHRERHSSAIGFQETSAAPAASTSACPHCCSTYQCAPPANSLLDTQPPPSQTLRATVQKMYSQPATHTKSLTMPSLCTGGCTNID